MNLEGLTEKWSNHPIKSRRVKYYENANGEMVCKHCTKCNEIKVLDEFTKDKTKLGGMNSRCKMCVSEYGRKKYASNRYYEIRKPVKIEERGGVIGKECTKCGEWKQFVHYSKHNGGLGGKRSECKTCEAEYYENNKDRILENDRRYRAENKEREAERIRKWYENNKSRKNEARRKWRQNNRDKEMLTKQRRRARKASLPDDFTVEQMEETLEYFGGCALTGSKSDIQWDHVIPLATGNGGTLRGNMIPLRGNLNTSKYASNIFEWFEANRQRFNLEQWRFDRLIEWLGKANGMTVEEYRDYVYECHANPNEIDDAKAN
jgi:hypothetical protein